MIEISLKKTLTASHGEMDLDIDFQLKNGELASIYGVSGAGKTSIFRMIAGLMDAEDGHVIINGRTWYSKSKNIKLKSQDRKVGLVFQDYALFPNMTVRQNLLFALEKGQDKSIVGELEDIVELGELSHRYPDKLSGGQKQRVALARALVRKPDLLLLDEALSALDMDMRSKLQDYILKVHRKYKLTTLLISHEMGEIIKMSDRIIVLDKGKITKDGKPIEVFSKKKVSGKFQFTGELIKIEKTDVVFILTILVGSNFIKVIATEEEAEKLQPGDQLLVASKAFNPIIQKI